MTRLSKPGPLKPGSKRSKPVKIMTRHVPLLDWQEELRRRLIKAGTDGIKQNKLVRRFNHWIDSDEILAELELLATLHKVQKFVTSGRGRPATVWRATTEILKESHGKEKRPRHTKESD